MLITVEGRRRRITAWAEEYGIPVSLIRSRLKRGWGEERAVTEPMIVRQREKLPADAMLDIVPEPKPVVSAPASSRRPRPPACASLDRRNANFGPQPRLYEHEGLALSIPEWAERVGIGPQALYARLRKGASLEEAFAVGDQRSQRTQEAKRIEFNGEALTIAQWAERTGLSYFTIRSRLRLGWSTERALTQPSPKDIDPEQPRLCATPGRSNTFETR